MADGSRGRAGPQRVSAPGIGPLPDTAGVVAIPMVVARAWTIRPRR
jgi:hypothetical protein